MCTGAYRRYGVVVAEIEIITEHETEHGWSFTLRIQNGTHGALHTATLAWADYEHWTHGTIPPAHLAKALVRVAIESLKGQSRPECFDAGRLSRQIQGFREKLAKTLQEL